MTKPTVDLADEAHERYERAVELAGRVRAEWEAAGRPLTREWAPGRVSEHVLLEMLRECEKDAERFARPLTRLPRGRQPVAVMEPSPASLRRIK